MNDKDLLEKYAENYNKSLKAITQELENHFIELFSDNDRIDRISARPKSIRSFSEKAISKKDGVLKYKYPLIDIQDQIGVRIVCFYLSDLKPIEKKIKEYFSPIEEEHKKPDEPNEFGYEGTHFILFIPDAIRNPKISKEDCPEVFELQIKTVYQHAWAAANHDLGYKSEKDLPKDQRRKIAFTAAQSWGADLIFNELAEEIHKN